MSLMVLQALLIIKLQICNFLSPSNQYQGPDLAQYGVSVNNSVCTL